MELQALLRSIYGPDKGLEAERWITELLTRVSLQEHVPGASELTERDALLIAYADQVQEPGVAPLRTLAGFCERHLAGIVSGVHLLPFYPWSSDDGFSVKDYYAVAPEYGRWEDIASFRPQFDLMVDAVFNHASAQGGWFQSFLREEPEFKEFFVTVEGECDISQVVRPRTLPLLTEFQSARGPVKVWTTFSEDQVDLNVRNPRVLVALLDVLLFYVRQGARFIRLDAIAYLCKEGGTSCIHLPDTHAVVQVFRAVLNMAAPHVQLITETNVPHTDNISYFGDGTNEAQLVYNFALPPLVLHALLRGDASYLTRWAAELKTPSEKTTFFNFLASHDGIGVNPARGILPEREIDYLVKNCSAHGGFINYKHNTDGTKSPYEMNIVYFDALNDPGGEDSIETQVNRFMVSQAIMLSLAGVPGIYFHSLFGSRNDRGAATSSGINRRINRKKLRLEELESELADSSSLRARVFSAYRALLKMRGTHPAFSPKADQHVLDVHPGVFAVRRGDRGGDSVLCLHNVTGSTLQVDAAGYGTAELQPYEVRWIAGLPPSSQR